MAQTQYETLHENLRRFGKTGFLEVSRKRVAAHEGGSPGEEFILVTRGFFAQDGTKKWTRFVTLPDDAETRAWLADALKAA
jgi:hypothetical protein